MSASDSNTRNSLGSFCKNRQLKKTEFSSPQGANPNHLCQELRGLLLAHCQQGQQLLHTLNVGKLMGRDQPRFEPVKWVCRQWRRLNQVCNQYHCGFREGRQHIKITGPLRRNVLQLKNALHGSKPGFDVGRPKGRQLDRIVNRHCWGCWSHWELNLLLILHCCEKIHKTQTGSPL
jgi:hypothetical protein